MECPPIPQFSLNFFLRSKTYLKEDLEPELPSRCSSGLLTFRILSKCCLGITATAIASAGRVATAFQDLFLKAFPFRIRVMTFVSMVMMVYLASATTHISHSRTDARVGHVTLLWKPRFYDGRSTIARGIGFDHHRVILQAIINRCRR